MLERQALFFCYARTTEEPLPSSDDSTCLQLPMFSTAPSFLGLIDDRDILFGPEILPTQPS
jgi:hypothetical protein